MWKKVRFLSDSPAVQEALVHLVGQWPTSQIVHTFRTNVAPGRAVATYRNTYRRRVFLVVKGDKGVALASVVGVHNSAIPNELISLFHH